MKRWLRPWNLLKWCSLAALALLTVFFPFPNCNAGWSSSSGLAVGLWDARPYFASPGSPIAAQIANDLARPPPSVRKSANGFFLYPSLNQARIGLPQLTLPALSVAIAVVAWRMDVRTRRRMHAGACQSCGYDRAGLAGGAKGAACPECGRKKDA